MTKQAIIKVIRQNLHIKFDKATWAEWIKIDTTGIIDDNKDKPYAMLPINVNLDKLADKILEKTDFIKELKQYIFDEHIHFDKSDHWQFENERPYIDSLKLESFINNFKNK